MAGRISVILPTYNRADLIGETIDSLLAQTRMPTEIILVDDGSSDETAQTVAGYGDPVRYVRKENGGKASALNLAMEQVAGDYVWICDDDDLLLPDAAARLAGALDGDDGLEWCAGKHEDFTVDSATGEKQIKAPGYWRPSTPEELFPDLLDGCHIFQPSLMVRKSVYEVVGPFKAALTRSQDYEMLLRIARRHRGQLLRETVFLHREHTGDRGSAKERFSAAQMTAKWIKFHRMIMGPLMADLADDELLPPSLGAGARTKAIKRASVYGRHLMWDEAADIFAAVARDGGPDLTEFERGLVEASTLYSLGCEPLYGDPAMGEKILALKSLGAHGKAIVALIGKSMQWRAKDALKAGRLGETGQIARFVAKARF